MWGASRTRSKIYLFLMNPGRETFYFFYSPRVFTVVSVVSYFEFFSR